MQIGGIVKVSSNSNATGVRYTDIICGAKASEFEHTETVPFMEWQLREYLRSYGDKRDVNRRPGDGEIYAQQKGPSDMVYIFKYAPSGAAPPKLTLRYPPAKNDLMVSQAEGNLKNLYGAAREKRVDEIYQLFMSYVNGIHIG